MGLYAFSAAVILGAIGPPSLRFVGENLAPVLAMPYFFVGVAVAHSPHGACGPRHWL
ncbi:MAG: hypothetical protein U1F33_16890 [Alphaproteobacteria bacterium]